MFATLAGGYPFGPLPGLTRSFVEARERWVGGELAAEAFAAEADRHVSQIAAEQAVAGLDLVEDAWARVPGTGLDGVVAGLLDGSVTAEGIADGWQRLSADVTVAAKVVLPGPWTVGRRVAETAAPDIGAHAGVVTGALISACLALARAGCPMVMLAEPELAHVGEAPADWRAVERALGPVLEAVAGPLHVCLAITGGAPAPAGHALLAALPVSSHLVDVTAGPAAWRYLAAIPGDRGVIVGAVAAASSELDDPEMLVWAGTLAAEHGDRGPSRVGIAPSGSLAGISRHHARRKAERMGEAVRLSRMGPLGEVARALQADPAACRIPSLRRLIADHDAVLPSVI